MPTGESPEGGRKEGYVEIPQAVTITDHHYSEQERQKVPVMQEFLGQGKDCWWVALGLCGFFFFCGAGV
jgi:hypothetical protein